MKVYLEIQDQQFYLYGLKSEASNSFSLEVLHEGPDDQLKDESTIKQIRKNLESYRVKRCEALLDKKYVISRFLVLPASTQEEVNQMVRFEAVKHLPYGYDEYYHKHLVMSFDIDGAKVLFVAVEKTILDQYVELARALNLEITNLELDILLQARYHFQHIKEPRENTLYLYFFPTNSGLYLVFSTKDEILFWRTMQPFSYEYLNDESFSERLNAQLKLNYEYLKRENKLEAEELVVLAPDCCAGSLNINFVPSVTIQSYSFPLDLSHPEMNGRFPLFCMKELLPGHEGEPYFLNLLPQYYLDSLSKSHRIKQYVQMGIGVALLLGSVAFGMYNVHMSHHEARDDYTTLLNQYRPLAQELNEKQRRVKNLKTEIHTEADILTVIDKIATIEMINSRVSIIGLEYSKGNSVRITGLALSLSDVPDFREELTGLNIFREVGHRGNQHETVHGTRVVRFEFMCNL